MNRRGFLRLLGMAPAVAPIAAQVMAQPYATGGFVSGECLIGLSSVTFGEFVVGESLSVNGSVNFAPPIYDEIARERENIIRNWQDTLQGRHAISEAMDAERYSGA